MIQHQGKGKEVKFIKIPHLRGNKTSWNFTKSHTNRIRNLIVFTKALAIKRDLINKTNYWERTLQSFKALIIKMNSIKGSEWIKISHRRLQLNRLIKSNMQTFIFDLNLHCMTYSVTLYQILFQKFRKALSHNNRQTNWCVIVFLMIIALLHAHIIVFILIPLTIALFVSIHIHSPPSSGEW